MDCISIKRGKSEVFVSHMHPHRADVGSLLVATECRCNSALVDEGFAVYLGWQSRLILAPKSQHLRGSRDSFITAARGELEPDTNGPFYLSAFSRTHNFHQFLLFRFDRREASLMKAFEINITKPRGVSNWALTT